jgi:hypothetical protein
MPSLIRTFEPNALGIKRLHADSQTYHLKEDALFADVGLITEIVLN